MLSQLTRLSVEAEGRYAKSEELLFLKGYFQSVEQRVSAYEKIRNAEAEIISQVEAKIRSIDLNLFFSGSHDFSERWRHDVVKILRYSAAACLFNEQDHLREGFLLWFRTISTSYKFSRTCRTTFMVMPEVVKQYLNPEEAALFSPILELDLIVLAN